MLIRTEQQRYARCRNALAIAGLTAALALATLAAISLDARSATSLSAAPSLSVNVAAFDDDGLPGKGLPPSPGPTNPDGALT